MMQDVTKLKFSNSFYFEGKILELLPQILKRQVPITNEKGNITHDLHTNTCNNTSLRIITYGNVVLSYKTH
jgi:hypothetical protein